jgi:hypothetical protein
MLFVSGGLCPLAGRQIVFAKEVEQCSVAQTESFVGFALVVDEKRELDAGFLAEKFGIAGIAEPNNSEMSTFILELGFEFAQLRDVLSAKDSTVVAQEDHNGGSALPQGAKAGWFAIDVRERDSGKLAAERFSHAGHSLGRRH